MSERGFVPPEFLAAGYGRLLPGAISPFRNALDAELYAQMREGREREWDEQTAAGMTGVRDGNPDYEGGPYWVEGARGDWVTWVKTRTWRRYAVARTALEREMGGV